MTRRRLKGVQKATTADRVPLSEAIKKFGVRSAFGVTAVDLHRNERIEYAIKNALASLEVEGQTLSEDAIQLIKRRLSEEITEEEFFRLAREIATRSD